MAEKKDTDAKDTETKGVDAKPWDVLGPIGDAILFENDTIRVWSISLEPGGRQPWHQHLHPYLIVPLTPGKNVMTFSDGRVRETNETPGEVIWRDAGIPHELVNVSDWRYRNVLIEVKTPGGEGIAAQTAAHLGGA